LIDVAERFCSCRAQPNTEGADRGGTQRDVTLYIPPERQIIRVLSTLGKSNYGCDSSVHRHSHRHQIRQGGTGHSEGLSRTKLSQTREVVRISARSQRAGASHDLGCRGSETQRNAGSPEFSPKPLHSCHNPIWSGTLARTFECAVY
jgi:hypothetical protein